MRISVSSLILIYKEFVICLLLCLDTIGTNHKYDYTRFTVVSNISRVAMTGKVSDLVFTNALPAMAGAAQTLIHFCKIEIER